MNNKTLKIIAWTLGMAFVGLMIGSKHASTRFDAMDAEYAFGGACVGLLLGLFFAARMRKAK